MLFHICTDEEWQEARVAGVYVAEAMQRDGFVHCSDPGTVHLPANRLYNARTDLVLLQVDPARLSVPVTWEPGIDGPVRAVVPAHLWRDQPGRGRGGTPLRPQ